MSAETLHNSLPPSGDRMLTTLFLAALLHGIVILGVTFSDTDNGKDGAAPALEVILVGDQAPAIDKNPRAKYLAERSQRGTGNASGDERARIPKSSPLAVDRAGLADGNGLNAGATGQTSGADEVLATRAPKAQILYFVSRSTAELAEMPLLLESRPDLGMSATDEGVELRLRGAAKQELWLAADTQESNLAVYLDSWRRKVERVGTLNFPGAARREGLSGTPVVEVVIESSGRLAAAAIRRSSGHAELDQAALRILRLASPFDPFPKALGQGHDQLRFAYEWQFLDGASQGSSVSLPAP